MNLSNSVGWDLYREYINVQVEVRKQGIIFKALPTADAVYEQEFQKGEVSGMNQMGSFLKYLIEGVEAELIKRNKDSEKLDNG